MLNIHHECPIIGSNPCNGKGPNLPTGLIWFFQSPQHSFYILLWCKSWQPHKSLPSNHSLIILYYISRLLETGHSVIKEIMQSHCILPFSICSMHWVSPYLPASSATNPSSWAQRSPGHCWWSVCQSWSLPAAEPAQSGTPLHCTKQRRAMRQGFYIHTHTYTQSYEHDAWDSTFAYILIA